MKTHFDNPVYRQPPCSLDAEKALLGAILIDNRAIERASEILEADHFFDQLHGAIYEATAKLIAAGRRADPITLKPFFDGAEPVGATPVPIYLGQLALNAATIINVRDYARTIHDLSIRRSLINIGETMVNAAYDSPVDFPPKEQIEEIERRLYGLAEHGESQSDGEPMGVVLDRVSASIRHARENPGANAGVATSLVDLDRRLGGGLQPSDLVILAGRPAMGKTGLAGTIARNVNVPTHIFSLEMTSEQIVMRLVAAELNVPTDQLRRGLLSDCDWERFKEAERKIRQRLKQRNVFIDPTGGISIGQLCARARRRKRQMGTELIIVDYIQLMQATKGNRTLEITEITTGLKALAKELNVPVVALSQLSRAVESREGKRPQLSDLRESGSIEQDADVVMFVFREEYYVERQRPSDETSPEFKAWMAKMRACAGKAEIIIDKARHGAVGIVGVQFNPVATLFSNLVRSGQDHNQH